MQVARLHSAGPVYALNERYLINEKGALQELPALLTIRTLAPALGGMI